MFQNKRINKNRDGIHHPTMFQMTPLKLKLDNKMEIYYIINNKIIKIRI